MLAYYALYDRAAGVGPPRGLLVEEVKTGDGLVWNHRIQSWQYNPGLVARTVHDWRNEDRLALVERAEAERVALLITDGQESLPDEETIYWIFQWKGEPPRRED
jgi:hypothetical protein